jgi:hypothetical protein
LLLALVVSVTAFSLVAFADEPDELDDGQSIGQIEEEQTLETETETLEDDGETETEPETPPTEESEPMITSEEKELSETEYIPTDDYERETLATLKSIEYQLKIIAGGVVLAVASAFIWFTILKPIKKFV